MIMLSVVFYLCRSAAQSTCFAPPSLTTKSFKVDQMVVEKMTIRRNDIVPKLSADGHEGLGSLGGQRRHVLLLLPRPRRFYVNLSALLALPPLH
jgi:hypothetical protein